MAATACSTESKRRPSTSPTRRSRRRRVTSSAISLSTSSGVHRVARVPRCDWAWRIVADRCPLADLVDPPARRSTQCGLGDCRRDVGAPFCTISCRCSVRDLDDDIGRCVLCSPRCVGCGLHRTRCQAGWSQCGVARCGDRSRPVAAIYSRDRTDLTTVLSVARDRWRWNSCMPSSQLTLASKPRSVAARSGPECKGLVENGLRVARAHVEGTVACLEVRQCEHVAAGDVTDIDEVARLAAVDVIEHAGNLEC